MLLARRADLTKETPSMQIQRNAIGRHGVHTGQAGQIDSKAVLHFTAAFANVRSYAARAFRLSRRALSSH
jgi:hypothetical protein